MSSEMFGPYRLLDRLGQGGMGEVWRAVDTRKDREVALKVLGSWLGGDPDFGRRFRREAALAARLNGPHIVPIHDYGEIDDRLFIDMAMIPGIDLAGLLERDGPLPVARAVEVVSQVAIALDIAHEAATLHRDVKPSNIIITSRFGRDYAYLIDFGIARAIDGTQISLSGAVVGTPSYMAPERFDGDGDRRADIYALTCVLYEGLTGRRPFPVTGLWAALKAHHDLSPPRPSEHRSGLPSGLDPVIARGMAKDPAERFAGAMELAAAARAALDGSRPDLTAPDTPVDGTSAPAAESSSSPAGDPSISSGPPIEYRPASDDRVVEPRPPDRPNGRGAATDAASRPMARPTEVPGGTRGPQAVPRIRSLDRRWSNHRVATAIGLALLLVAIGIVALVLPHRTPADPAAPEAAGPSTGAAEPSVAVTTRPTFTVASSIAVGRSPSEMAITPDGGRVLVCNSFSYTIGTIDATTGKMTAEIRVGNLPTGIVMAPNGEFAYVANYESGSISVIDVKAGSVVSTIKIGGVPYNVDITPDGRFVYVTDLRSETVVVISTATRDVQATIELDGPPTDVAISPDGRHAYVSGLQTGVIWVIDTAIRAVTDTIADPGGSIELAVTPDGSAVYGAHTDSNAVSIVDTATDKVAGTIPVTGQPYDVAFTPDGRYAFVPNLGAETVSVVDVATRAIVADIPLPGGPSRAVVAPDGSRVYVTNDGPNTVAVIDRVGS